jgi:signal transduction histidine kinase
VQNLPITQARMVALLRLLLLAIALASVAAFLASVGKAPVATAAEILQIVLIGVALATGGLLILVGRVRHAWQLTLHLVFDLLWIGAVLWCTGGPASPGVVLLFAVVLIGNLVLPGVAPFLMPALASLTLAVVSVLHVAGRTPLSSEIIRGNPDLVATGPILTGLAIQVIALFLVDILGQTLARRQTEIRRFAGEVLDQLAEGVLAVDPRGVLVYLNAEVIRLLDLHRHAGRPATDLVGTSADDALAGASLAPVRELLARSDGTVVRRVDLQDRHLVLRVSPLSGPGGRRIGRTLLVADETRLRVLEESARRAERLAALGEMAAGIAHEVRNPLTSLRGCGQELAEICLRMGDRDASDLSTILVGEADRISRIVDDFLTFARQRPPVRQAVHPASLLGAVESLVTSRRDLPAGLTFRVTSEPGCPQAYVDQDQIRQVLINVVDNALDALATITAPRIELRAAQADDDGPLGEDAVVISISDNGCGIPDDLQERVFTPFYSTKARGTGLGLSLVTRIVREHGGVVHLVSHPGEGTRIAIHLPAFAQTREYRRALGGSDDSTRTAIAVLPG